MRRLILLTTAVLTGIPAFAGGYPPGMKPPETHEILLPYGLKSRYYVGNRNPANPDDKSLVVRKLESELSGLRYRKTPVSTTTGSKKSTYQENNNSEFVLNFRGIPFEKAVEFLGREFGLKYVFESDSGSVAGGGLSSLKTATTKGKTFSGGLPVYRGAKAVSSAQSVGYDAPVNVSVTVDSLDEAVRTLCRAADYYCYKVGDTWHVKRYKTVVINFPDLFGVQVEGGLSGSSDKAGFVYTQKQLIAKIKSLLSPEGKLFQSEGGYVVVQDRPSYVQNVLRVLDKEKEQTRAVKLNIKVVRVDLKKEYQSGIDWNAILKAGGSVFTTGASFASAMTGNTVSFGINRSDLTALFKFLSQFGDVKVVKEWNTVAISGRPIFTNNVEEVPWFSQTTTTNANTAETATEVHFKNVGLQIKILPEIYGNHLRGSIYAEVSSLLGFEEAQDGSKAPHTAVSNAFVNFDVPIGKSIVISGLKEKNYENSNAGVPVLKDVPLIGQLFGEKTKKCDVSEVVIIITPESISDI